MLRDQSFRGIDRHDPATFREAEGLRELGHLPQVELHRLRT
jgi:hypothetical protein